MKEIFVEKENNLKKIYLIEDKKIIEMHSEDEKNPMIEGNIYVGKVQNVLPGIGAAFVRIGNSKNAFIHLKDIIPKENEALNQTEISKYDIRDFVKPGDKILVQITRDESFKKGARVTKHISFTGRFFVYMPNTPFVAVSQKIDDQEKREELKKFFKENLPEGAGGVIRTNSKNATKAELLREIKLLDDRWEKIKNTPVEKIPVELYNAGGVIKKYLIDNFDKGLEKVYVSNEELKNEISELLKEENIDINIEVSEEYLKKYDYEKQLESSKNRKIWLDCGGFITIDRTEALTAIDVNTGKYTGKDDIEKTIYEVNKEATIEIARQLKLRDIGGIIIIDYIDMHIEENKEKIMALMNEEIKKDSSKVQIEGFTKLNLMELTRKHIYTV